MLCPKCQGETAVKDSRLHKYNIIRRRRRCKKHGHRFTTFESTNPKFIEDEIDRTKAKIEKLRNRIKEAYGAFLTKPLSTGGQPEGNGLISDDSG